MVFPSICMLLSPVLNGDHIRQYIFCFPNKSQQEYQRKYMPLPAQFHVESPPGFPRLIIKVYSDTTFI